MKSETLSQQEIDLLFGGGASVPEAPASASHSEVEIQIYDFRRPNRISKDRHRSLEAMYGMLAKSIETWLTARVRTQVELNLLAVEHFSFGEFLLSLPTPCASYVYDIADSGEQQAVIDFGSDFSFFLIERMLGGSASVDGGDRGLTPLERMIVRLVADQVAVQLTDIWRDHIDLELELSRFESIPDMLQITNREDPVLVANVEVTAGGMRSLLLICLPFAVLESFFSGTSMQRVHAYGGSDEDREVDRIGVESSLLRSRVPVVVRMPELKLSMRELLELKPGSIVPTGVAPDGELDVYVAGRPRYRAVPGRLGQKLAARVVEVLEPDVADGEV